MIKSIVLVLVALSAWSLEAQVTTRHATVRAAGQASVFVAPDQVKIDISVVTQGATAQEATSKNASQSDGVLGALRKLLGQGADIKTINYSVTPNYKYPQGGGNPALTGYTATNTVEVTLSSTSSTGAVLDTASDAGATSIGGLSFSIKDPDPPRRQALRQAVQQAKSHADAMASGLGNVVGAVTSLEEGSAVRVVPIVTTNTLAGAGTPTTTVQPGLIEVQANVVLEAELN
jgi:uncharacterized protein YggE